MTHTQILRDALTFAADVVELFDDATMRADYMLDSADCGRIIRALAESSYLQEKFALRATEQAPSPIAGEVTTTPPMCERKTDDLVQRGYRKIGYILARADGKEYALSDGAVRWLSQPHYHRLMHEQDGSLFGTQPAAKRSEGELSRKNHVGNGLRWAEAIAAEQITADRTALAQQQQAGGVEGWQMVPKELDDTMRTACRVLLYADDIDAEWRRLLAAAPTLGGKDV